MVFESLINPINAEKTPWMMFLYGVIYSSVAVILSWFIFRNDASLVMIFLTTLACIQVVYTAIKMEEKKDLEYSEERVLIKEHGKALSFFMFLFLGFMVSFSLWNIFLPPDASGVMFSTQLRDIEAINQIATQVTGNAIVDTPILSRIFLNNLMVMAFCLLFSFFYGVGAIFILTWNASVMGAAIGIFVRDIASTSYLASIPLALMRYSLHGLPEMLAYFMAGLAGGIISVAIIRHDFGSGRFKHILTDSIDMILLACFVLFAAALIEVYVTPAIFY